MALFNHRNFLLDTLRDGIYPFYEMHRNAQTNPNVAQRTEQYLNAQRGGESFLKAKRLREGLSATIAGVAGTVAGGVMMALGVFSAAPAIIFIPAAASYLIGLGKMVYHLERLKHVQAEEQLFTNLADARLTELLENNPQEMMGSSAFKQKIAKSFGLVTYRGPKAQSPVVVTPQVDKLSA